MCTRALRQWRSRLCSARVAWLPASSNSVVPAAREISVLMARASATAMEAAATLSALLSC
ncbi:hypothetical protein D3C80_2014070 [compost metagenome]